MEGCSGCRPPLGGYAALLGIFATGVGALTVVASRRRCDAWASSDLVLTGLAAQELARIVTKDIVTSVLRAPFTEPEGNAGAGEVGERFVRALLVTSTVASFAQRAYGWVRKAT